jgi:hypothetical protein
VENDFDLAHQIKDRKDESQAIPHDEYHGKCSSSPTFKQRLGILSVCRQIHHEAALLPFSGNSFSFDSAFSLYKFLESVAPQQAAAVKSILLQLGSPQRGQPSRRDILPKLQDLVCKRLAQIEKLILFVEMRYDSSAIFFFHSEKIRNFVAEEAMLLHRFSLSSVRVVLYTASSLYGVIPAQLARNWEEELERQFLIPWNPTKKRKERREAGRMAAEISRKPKAPGSRRQG